MALLAACLAAGPGAAASHRSAACLWRLAGVAPPPQPEIVKAGIAAGVPGVVCHRTNELGPDDVVTRDGVPVTSPARTLVDLGRVVSPYVVEIAFTDATERRLCSADDVRAVYERRAGDRWTAMIRELLDAELPGDARLQSKLERKALRALRRGGFPEPVKQHPVPTDRGVYHIDLAYPEYKIGIELLGFGPHSNRRAFDRDPLRRNELQNDGWIVLEFTSRTPLAVLLGQVSDGRSRRDVEIPVEKRPISRRHRKEPAPAV